MPTKEGPLPETMVSPETGRSASGSIAGVAVGVVKANDDPLGLGRVKLGLPWREPDFVTEWARIATPMGGDARGAYFVPEVGDEVLVAFERDDIRYPYVLGALWGENEKPPESNANRKNDIRLIKSRKGHMLRFDDADARGVITIQLNDGKKVEIDDDGIRITDQQNKVEIDSKSGAVIIEAASALSLKAPHVTIEASSSLELKAGSSLTAIAGLVRIN